VNYEYEELYAEIVNEINAVMRIRTGVVEDAV
jgi:hypothetical protein